MGEVTPEMIQRMARCSCDVCQEELRILEEAFRLQSKIDSKRCEHSRFDIDCISCIRDVHPNADDHPFLKVWDKCGKAADPLSISVGFWRNTGRPQDGDNVLFVTHDYADEITQGFYWQEADVIVLRRTDTSFDQVKYWMTIPPLPT